MKEKLSTFFNKAKLFALANKPIVIGITTTLIVVVAVILVSQSPSIKVDENTDKNPIVEKDEDGIEADIEEDIEADIEADIEEDGEDTANTDSPSKDKKPADDKSSNDKKPADDKSSNDKPVNKPADKPSNGGGNKPADKPSDKPAGGGGNKPAGKPIDKQGATTCSAIPKTTVKEYTNMYFPNEPQLKNMGITGSNGEKCTAVVTTTQDGKIIGTKTITVSEKAMIPDEVWIGTKADELMFWSDFHAYFTTVEAAKNYALNFKGEGIEVRFWNEVGNKSLKGDTYYQVRFLDIHGKPIHTAGWSEGYSEFSVSGGRVHKK